MIPLFIRHAAYLAGFAALGLTAIPPATAQNAGPVRADMSLDQLKRVYLDCERAAISGELGTDAIMGCSIAYEELKRRAFDGDFRRMKAWFDAQREEAGRVSDFDAGDSSRVGGENHVAV